MQKNDIFEIEITDMGVNGEGIGHHDGMTFFIKDALIGDVITARVTKLKKNYGYARVEEIKSPSTFRIEPKCELHRRCGGCQIQALDYVRQLQFKEDKVRGNLVRIGGFSEELLDKIMLPIVGMQEPYRYRNKAQFPVGYGKNGEIISGFYASRSHNIIDVEDCMLGVPVNKDILDVIKRWMRKYDIEPYDENSGKGLLRHVLIRYGFTTEEIMVCLIINGRKLTASEELIAELTKIKGMTSISININTKNTNVILGDETQCIWGQPYITDHIHLRKCPNYSQWMGPIVEDDAFEFTGSDVAYHISPQSFYQVNPIQTEKLYSTAVEFAGLTGNESVWDLYCGIGTISLFLSQKAKQVYGVEIVPQAIEDAKNNAVLNGITNASFFVGKAEEVLPEFYENAMAGAVQNDVTAEADTDESAAKGDTDMSTPEAGTDMSTPEAGTDMSAPDVIVVDPPRKGCDEKCLDTMIKMHPKKIVYVSCDSATLARDLRVLCEGGYELKKVQAFDQFAHTLHVETVVLLSQQKEDDYLEVEIDLDELDATSAETKATYEEIKKYVTEHNEGMKVSNLYIAQVKKKCGIELGQNFNLPKSENAKQPQCPKDKEKAIRDAMKHFKMM